MSENMDGFELNESNYFQIIKNNITPLDLFILSKLNEGISLDEIISLAEKEFNLKDAKKSVHDHYKKLISEDDPEEGVILKSMPQYLINPSKVYNNIFLILIKANIDCSKSTNLDIGLNTVFDTIIDLNNKPKYGKPIKQLFTTTGWTFDYCGIVYENNIERFHKFRNHLINEGIAKSVDIVNVDSNQGFLFNPISSPYYTHFQHFLIHYRNRMNHMIDELHKSDVNETKTKKFFDKEEYCLLALNGKNKGDMYPLDVSELKIGRYYDNDIIIQDISVSRRHAKIEKLGNKFIFKDQSTNGSYVNDKKVLYDEIELKKDDIIKIGNISFKFQKLRLIK